MSIRLLAGSLNTYGSSYFRIQVPASYFPQELPVDFYKFRFNKFSRSPVFLNQPHIDKLTGYVWDNMKLLECYYYIARSRKFDATIVSRSLLNFQNRADLRLRNFFYDIDDSVWLSDAAHCFKHHCEQALFVFAGNSFLADAASKYTKKIQIIPTSVDLTRYVKTQRQENSRFNVGWVGSSSGFPYLKDIERALLSFFSSHSDARLVIVSDRYPNELESLASHIEFHKWHIDQDVEMINTFSVGIMPLKNTEWERGKCSFKMLQYLACEVPVLVSAVGMNSDILKLDKRFGLVGVGIESEADWAPALDHYYNMEDETRSRQGSNGRALVSENFSTTMISQLISKTILSCFE